MDPREHWRTVYATKSPEEVSWFEAEAGASLQALRRLQVKPDMAIVDIGAGASRLADALLDLGFTDITLLDIADSALDASRARLGALAGRVSWQVADVREWRPEQSFDVWHDRAVFHFLTTPEDQARYLDHLHAVLKARGSAIIATFAPDGPEKCSGLPVARYSPESLAKRLGSAFTLAESRRHVHQTPWGSSQPFQYSRFRRVH